jgi:hypothetical protein
VVGSWVGSRVGFTVVCHDVFGDEWHFVLELS